MSVNIEVFLGNKLISCDTVVPFILSLKKQDDKIKVNYNIFDYKSFLAIKKNEFLYFSLRRTGKLYYRGSSNQKNNIRKIIIKINSFLFLLKLCTKLFLTNTKIFHFGVLCFAPFKLLQILFSKNIFLMETLCWFEHKNARILDNIISPRSSKRKDKIMMLSTNVIYFNTNYFRNYKIDNFNTILMENPRRYRTWYEHVIKYGIPKVQSQLKALNYDFDKGYYLYVLGYIGKIDRMHDTDSLEFLVYKTLKLLYKYGNGVPILIKPHINTDVTFLYKIIEKYNYDNVHITYLHPAALSVNAKLVISNCFSNTQADADFFGAPTVEFTYYSEAALKATNGESENPIYIKYFVNNDTEKFKNIIKNSITLKVNNKVKNIYEDDKASSVVTKFFQENL